MADDVEILVPLVAALNPQERQKRWTHLSLCILDAVFSIGARYEGTTRTVWRYAESAKLADPLLPPPRAREVIGTQEEERLPSMLKRIEGPGREHWMTEELRNRQRTSTQSGIPKAEAAQRHAQVLIRHGIETLDAVASLLEDDTRIADVEADLARIPGHGQGGIRLGYLWMLAGDDDIVKPDRMVLRWIGKVLKRPVGAAEARMLVAEVARRLGCSPWAVDHAIWLDASGRSGPPPAPAAK